MGQLSQKLYQRNFLRPHIAQVVFILKSYPRTIIFRFISAGHSYVDVVQMKMKLLIIYRQLRLWKIVAIVTELH